MKGKQKCKILKEIRQKIADENDIPYITRECHFQGECMGTCPKCESELRYLEQQLALRSAMKKKITVAAICAGMVVATAGCNAVNQPGSDRDLGGAVPYEKATEKTIETTTGEVAPDDTTKITPAPSPESNTENQKPVDVELSGDVPYVEEK